jgi:sugar-specific transcriptional regulator TrmB
MRTTDPKNRSKYPKPYVLKSPNSTGVEREVLEDKHIQTLQNFGLSFLQAKTYLVLLMLGEADTKTIAKASNVARQEIYRVMPSLLKLGLGTKTISKPIMYKATPLKDALGILLKKQKQEVAKLENERGWLLNNIHSVNNQTLTSEDETQFTVTSELTLFFITHEKILSKTQETIDIIVPNITLPNRFNEMWTALQKKLNQTPNLRVRLITPRSSKIDLLPAGIVEYPGFEIRHSSEQVSFGMHIFDKKELTLAIAEKGGLPSLWSNNPNIVTIAWNYYELMWTKASPA